MDLKEEEEKLLLQLYPSRLYIFRFEDTLRKSLYGPGRKSKYFELKTKLTQRLCFMRYHERLPLGTDPLFPKLRTNMLDEAFREQVIREELALRKQQFLDKVRQGDLASLDLVQRLLVPAALMQQPPELLNLASKL